MSEQPKNHTPEQSQSVQHPLNSSQSNPETGLNADEDATVRLAPGDEELIRLRAAQVQRTQSQEQQPTDKEDEQQEPEKQPDTLAEDEKDEEADDTTQAIPPTQVETIQIPARPVEEEDTVPTELAPDGQKVEPVAPGQQVTQQAATDETVPPTLETHQGAGQASVGKAATVIPPVGANPYISVEDLVALQLVGEPQVSPDGLFIAYTVQKNDLDSATAYSTIWLVPATLGTDGKSQTARQLTNETNSSFMPRWSSDGRTLAFLSNRSGSIQIYTLSLNGGEARQVSFLQHNVSDFCWRPDGRAILIQSPWKFSDNQPDQNDEALVQIWTRLDESWDGQGYKQNRHEHFWLLELEGEIPATRLTFEQVNHSQPCWSPDGTEVAFCVNRRTAPDLSVSEALWVLTLATGRVRRLSPIDGLAQQPAWSPDGKWLAYYYATRQDETVNHVPWIVEANGQSAPRPATTGSQSYTSKAIIVDNLRSNTMSPPYWYPDSISLMVTVQTHGQVHLNRLYINTNHEEPLTTGNGCYLSPHLSANGRTIATLRTDWFTPGDIWAMAGNGAKRRRLTSVNDQLLRSRQVIRPKKVSWRSFDDLEIEGWLYLPTLQAGERPPLVLDVHGGPTLAWCESYVHDFQVLAGMGYAVLAANPRGSIGYGEEFCRKIINDWGGDDYRDLMRGLDHVIATEPVDGSRLAITGASYGGYMTCWAVTQSQRFKAAIARNPVTSLLTCAQISDQWLWFNLIMGGDEEQDAETLQRSCSPLSFADQITTPLLLIHSTNDLRCPTSESLQLFNALRRRQHTVEMALYPGVDHLLDYPGHGTPEQRIDRERREIEWLQKYL